MFHKKDIVYISLIAICIGLIVWTKVTTPKVAFVRSAIVVDGYLGMKEARKLTDVKMNQWQSQIDTLALDFERAVNNYNASYSKLNPKEKAEREMLLKVQEEKLERLKASIEEKANQENEKVTQGVLNQINSYIEKYSKEHGYDIVLGVTLSGNILYGTESTDITQEVLEGLNDSYKGK